MDTAQDPRLPPAEPGARASWYSWQLRQAFQGPLEAGTMIRDPGMRAAYCSTLRDQARLADLEGEAASRYSAAEVRVLPEELAQAGAPPP